MTAPADIQLERHLLGSVIAFPGAIEDVDELKAEDFFWADHGRIWRACQGCNGSLDLVVLSQVLQAQGWLDQVGGPAYLAELVDAAGTAANVAHYAGRIRDLALKRRLSILANKITATANDGLTTASEALDKAEAAIQALMSGPGERGGLTRLGSQDLTGTLAEIEERSRQPEKIVGLPSGLTDLDKLLGGGWQPGESVLIAGRPSMGKTALALAVMTNATLPDFRESGRFGPTSNVAFFSLEMQRDQILNRLLASLSGVDSKAIRTGQGLETCDFSALANAAGYLSRAGIWIDDKPAQTDAEIRRKAKRLKDSLERDGQALGLVVVDYLQLARSARKTASRELEISEISQALKAMAKDLGVTVIALSQLNRAVESRNNKRPMLSDLRESGSLEQDADVVVLMYRPGYYSNDPENLSCELLVRKHRNGPTGTVKTWMDLATGRFRSAQVWR